MPNNPRQSSLAFHIMSKPIGPLCNMDCRYCFYLEKDKLYPDTGSWAMSEEVLDSFIRQYIEANDIPTVSFAWQGGEPTLLGLDFFRRVVESQQKYAAGKRIENAMQTNGLLLDDAWGAFLAENRILVGLSIDGPPEIHDRYRIDKNGQPTFDRVYRGLQLLRKHGVEFNTLTCVQRHNARHPLEVYHFLRSEGSGFLQFIPVVERIDEQAPSDSLALVSPDSPRAARLAAWSVEPAEYGRFLCVIFDDWVRRDVGRYYIQLFDVALEAWMGMNPSLCVYSRTCGQGMALEHNGDLYSCDHYVYPQNRLGNLIETSLADMVLGRQQRQFGDAKFASLPRQCKDCSFLFACHGECPKHRFQRTHDGEEGLNYLCSGLQRFFTHVDPYMRFMAEELRRERPPANVMEWVKHRELFVDDSGRPGRNASCSCGSGRKYKKCCGRGAG